MDKFYFAALLFGIAALVVSLGAYYIIRPIQMRIVRLQAKVAVLVEEPPSHLVAVTDLQNFLTWCGKTLDYDEYAHATYKVADCTCPECVEEYEAFKDKSTW